MANVKISQLPSAASLTGSEEVPVVQSGVTKKTTAQAIANLGGGGGGGLGSLEINADGGVGGGLTQYYFGANIPGTYAGGDASFPVEGLAQIQMSGSGGYGGGGQFTATFITFPSLTLANGFNISGTNSLKTINAPLLTNVSGQLYLNGNSALESLNFPALTNLGSGISLGNNNTSVPLSLNFPVLINASFNTNNGSNLPNITSSQFPVLEKTNFNMYDGALVSVDLPSVKEVSSLQFTGSNNTTTINLPGLVTLGTSYIQFSLNNLQNFSIGTAGTLKSVANGSNMYIDLNQCKLNQASVDGLLTALASLDGTNGTTTSNNGSLYLTGQNATPSSVGLAAKAVLQSRGWNVATY